MGGKTSIEWTRGVDGSAGASWNPIRTLNRETGKVGWYCEHATPGCENCYSEAMNRRLGTGVDYKRQNRDKVELFLDEKILDEPLRWRRPRKIFVESMSDLFADFVLVEWIDRIFDVMEQCQHHTFIVLTKRAERMRDYFREQNECIWSPEPPPKWIWAGVSVEDQARADERIPLLLETPAAVRWISAEPLLGPVCLHERLGDDWLASGQSGERRGLDWIVIGGESGTGARPFRVEWARSIIAQCRAASVPVFTKQLGAVPIIEDRPPFNGGFPDGTHFGNRTGIRELNGLQVLLRDRKGGNPEEWASDLRVREYLAQERS